MEASFYYSSGTVFNSYIIHNPNSSAGRNHLICIVGWDDAFSYGGVTGAWIIKNSWGTYAGQSGYYYMTYGSSNLGDVGYFSSVSAADFWTTSNNAQYQINIYSGSFGSLLATRSGACAEEGYYSIPLTSAVNLNSGQQFTVAVKLTTLGYNYPLPVERVWSPYCNPPIQTGVSFARHYDGDAWSGLGSAFQRNACLRARVSVGGSVSADDSFPIVALPDTQHYSLSYPAAFTAQTQWIKDNKTTKNIVFVTQEGDIINDNANVTQWGNANASMSVLDGQVPYGIALGNNDGAPGSTTNFNSYFPYTRYTGQAWYGGHYGADNDNSYQLFSAGGQDFIVLPMAVVSFLLIRRFVFKTLIQDTKAS